jgi:uroporphyrinogen decarboxylase
MLFEAVALDHAAQLVNRRPWEISQDSGLLAEAMLKAAEVYGQHSIVAGVDVYNVEAEAYGCQVREPEGNGVPSIKQPLVGHLDDIGALRLDTSAGRIPMLFEAASEVARSAAGMNVRIPIAGPFTIACHLLGVEDMICELMLNPDAAERALHRLAANQIDFGRQIAQRGFAVTLYESSVTPPLLSPKLFSQRMAPVLGTIIAAFRDELKTSLQVIIGGDTLAILTDLLAARPDYLICPVETDQFSFVEQAAHAPATRVRVNMAAAVFLPGNRQAALEEANRVVEIASKHPDSTVGCLLPFDADPETVRAVAKRVRRESTG